MTKSFQACLLPTTVELFLLDPPSLDHRDQLSDRTIVHQEIEI